MPLYQFRIMTFERRQEAQYSATCGDDIEAVKTAREFLTKGHIVEIWQGSSKVGELDLAEPPITPAA